MAELRPALIAHTGMTQDHLATADIADAPKILAGGETETIRVGREELHVTRRIVDRGGIRVRIGVEERDESIDVLLREQSIEVTRVPVGRVVTTAPEQRQEGDTLVIPILEEVLVIERRLVLKEEIRVRRTEQNRPAHETARVRIGFAEVETLAPTNDVKGETHE